MKRNDGEFPSPVKLNRKYSFKELGIKIGKLSKYGSESFILSKTPILL